MHTQLIEILCLLAFCITLFMLQKPRMDVVALIAIIGLSIIGPLDFADAVSGFGNPIIVLIALMFVISEGLLRTGVSYRVGAWILRKSGRSETKIIVLIMVAASLLGAVMSTTGVIAIFLPIALSLAARLKISPSKILMPLSMAGLIGGMMTLVATAPNMIMSAALVQSGHNGFSFFAFTPIGLAVCAMGVVYMLFMRRFLGGRAEPHAPAGARKTLKDFVDEYALNGRDKLFYVRQDSPCTGKPLKDLPLRNNYSINILCVDRRERFNREVFQASAETRLKAGDILFADTEGNADAASAAAKSLGFDDMGIGGPYFTDRSMQVGMAEIAMPPESSLIGKTVLEAKFRSRYGINIVGIRRNSKPIDGNILEAKLKMGDILLVIGPWRAIKRLRHENADFLILTMPAELDDAADAPDRAPYAVLSLLITVLIMMTGKVPNAMAAMIGCLFMLFFKCLDVQKAYKAINWSSIVLIVGMMPFAKALEITGGIDIAANALLKISDGAGPHTVLAALFALTMFVGLFVSNTITAILLAPLALTCAEILHVSPYPFAMTVAIAASTGFMSPLSSSINILVWEPGRYTFWDFMRIGLPFSLLVMAVCVFLIPALFPF